jgi:N-acetyl-gamma-glutamyl-phosphate reductase
MVKVGIVGGTGYTGVELMRMLSRHDGVRLHMITSRKEAGMQVGELYESLRGAVDLRFTDTATADLTSCDVVFFATPHGVAMADAPRLLAAGVKIIDLAADFRLQDTAVFEQWYKMPHSCVDVLRESVYGLPEVHRAAIKKARVVGNPGCYPTTMILGYKPLIEAGAIDLNNLIADCKSGVSGAGRKAEMGLIFSETSDNFKAYGVSGHRHWPETEAQLNLLAKTKVDLQFSPHLVPMIRGMHSTLYATLTRDIDVQACFEAAYRDEPFVDVMPFGSHPETRSSRGSNMLRIGVHQPRGGKRVVILVSQDNLVKGAAGQAVQCMNLMFGLPETAGLTTVPLMP